VPVTAYEANYGGTYVASPPGVPVSILKAAAIRPNDQLAIEEVEASRLEAALTAVEPALASLFATSEQNNSPGPLDALVEHSDPGSPMLSRDTRAAILRAIKVRRGQRKFRDALIRRYGSKCMISECSLLDLVEAAHIWPYRGEHSNHVQNGLLLRADFHTLFDLDLLGIEPVTLAIKFHPIAIAAGYATFEGQVLRTSGGKRPGVEPLQDRWKAFQRRLRADMAVAD